MIKLESFGIWTISNKKLIYSSYVLTYSKHRIVKIFIRIVVVGFAAVLKGNMNAWLDSDSLKAPSIENTQHFTWLNSEMHFQVKF